MSVAETARSVVMDLSVDEGGCCDDDNNRRFSSRVRFRRLASNISSFCVPAACPSNLLIATTFPSAYAEVARNRSFTVTVLSPRIAQDSHNYHVHNQQMY